MNGDVLRHRAMKSSTLKIMSPVSKSSTALPSSGTVVRIFVVGAGDDPRSHRLERVGVLAAPHRAVAALPFALAHIVADGPAEHMLERLLRHVLAGLADHGDQLGLVLEFRAGVLGLHDLLVGAMMALGER